MTLALIILSVVNALILLALAILPFIEPILKVKGMKSMFKWVIGILAFCGVGTIVTIGILTYKIEKQGQEEKKAMQQKLDNIGTQFYDLTLNGVTREKIEDFISLKYQTIFNVSEEDAKKRAQDLIHSLPEKKEQMKSMIDQEKDLQNHFQLKWEPLYKDVLQIFDTYIAALQDKNLIKSYTKQGDTRDIVLIEHFPQLWQAVRAVKFQHGDTILVRMTPAKIQGGKLIASPELTIIPTINGSANFYLFSLYFSTTGYRLSYYEKVYSTTKDPLEDKDFHNEITNAINEIISSTLYEDALKR